ncbi:hypothetical protein J437_LFUL001669 [Ladona fulva]|uniref:Btz domain-containing protein n=1 Tax=Ladona fulva TaxID=123851 RepID=A0A8K0K2I1_LADFU|nr:hypothetical protein J437_LFUL001669 [Ladona fulva]
MRMQDWGATVFRGAKPIFDRDELRHAQRDVEVKYQDREIGLRQLYRTTREDRSRMCSQQPIEERVVAIVDDKPVLPSTSLQSLRGQVRRSRSPIATVSNMGSCRLESISPTPMAMEKSRSYYEASPPPRMSGGYGSSTNRHAWDFEQPGPSHSHSRNTSHARHKEGRRNEDLRYELENRRRDDASYERGNQDFRGDSDEASSDLRMRINEKRTTEHPRMTHYPDDVDEPVGVHSKSERRYAAGHHPMEVMHEPRRRGMESSGHRSGAHLQHEIDEPEEYNPRSSIQTKSSSSTVASWDGNPEYVPKGRAYYEHDNRDEWVRVSSSLRGARGYYVRGNSRGRYFRGGYVPRGRGRGRARGRGQHMGHISRGYTRGGPGIRRQGTSAPAVGGSHSTRGKPSSPSLWKHDMFENLSSDENKPASTTESKR